MSLTPGTRLGHYDVTSRGKGLSGLPAPAQPRANRIRLRVTALPVLGIAEAIETLAELMARDIHPNVRLGAARTVTELAIHRHDEETITPVVLLAPQVA